MNKRCYSDDEDDSEETYARSENLYIHSNNHNNRGVNNKKAHVIFTTKYHRHF